VLQLLLKKGASIEAKTKHGQTVLHRAATRGLITNMRLLLDKGVDMMAKDLYGTTPLHWAAANGSEVAV
jgi:ankyrin repeat protein